MYKKKTYFIWLLFLLNVSVTTAQNFSDLSNTEKLDLRLRSHILIDPNTIDLPSLVNIFKEKTPIALQLEKKHINLSFLEEYLKHYKKITILSNKKTTQLIETEVAVIQIKSSDVQTVKLNVSLLNDSLPKNMFAGLKPLNTIYLDNYETINDSLFLKIWTQSGELPNFIKADNNSLQKINRIVSNLNSQQKIFGVVRTEDELLQGVTFKDFSNEKINGYFSFPNDSTGSSPILIPHKAGYHFSPDIIYTTPENQNNLKEFIGFPLESQFGLSYHFMFNNAIKNVIHNNNEGLLSTGVLLKQDSIQGRVGYFNNRAYIDTGLESRSALKSSFTITSWVKPTKIQLNNSILGKGNNFVVKLHDGFLTFTMAGIKDYISNSSPVPLHKWTHIALVHSKENNELLFYINGKQTDKIELIAEYSTSDQHNLLIGSNLWEEFFIGYLNDLKIWERELNELEIQHQFESVSEKRSIFSKKLIYTVVLSLSIVLLLYVLFYRKVRRKRRQYSTIKKLNLTKSKLHNTAIINDPKFKEKILYFGGLQIINTDGINIAKNLSPKLKNLFIVIFLHSQGEDKGINTKKLTEILWPGMNVKNAKNTRGTSIQKLRTILSSCSEIKLIFQDKSWFIVLSERCYSDYNTALNYLEFFSTENYSLSTLEQELPNLLQLLKKGRLLTNTYDSWLDPFIEKISNQIIEQCSDFIEILDIEKHDTLLYDIAEVMNIYDDLNENALQLKLHVLILQGKLSLARNVYDNFIKLYTELYKENYSFTFEDMISEINIS